MTVQLDHTIVSARDREESATFMADVLGLPAPVPNGPFLMVETANGVALDFVGSDDDITTQHYAFLVNEPEFDEIFGRILERGLPHWADPGQTRPGEVRRQRDGGRGVYFEDPSGHLLEILTRPEASV